MFTKIITLLALLIVFAVAAFAGSANRPRGQDTAAATIVLNSTIAPILASVARFTVEAVEHARPVADAASVTNNRYTEASRISMPSRNDIREAPGNDRYDVAIAAEKRNQATYKGYGSDHLARADV